MAAGRRREEIDAKIARWEKDLERLRVALVNAPEDLNAKHHPTFVELYRRKEVAKSRWEAIRGVWPEAQGCDVVKTRWPPLRLQWPQAHATLTEVLRSAPHDASSSLHSRRRFRKGYRAIIHPCDQHISLADEEAPA
jgi:hypothetical protein